MTNCSIDSPLTIYAKNAKAIIAPNSALTLNCIFLPLYKSKNIPRAKKSNNLPVPDIVESEKDEEKYNVRNVVIYRIILLVFVVNLPILT